MILASLLYLATTLFQDPITSWLTEQPFPVVVSVRRLDNGKEIFQHRGKEWISPASTWKLYSVAIAKQKLGPNYRFRTPITYTGSILNQTLHGDLVFESSGDPTLGSERFKDLDPIRKLTSTLKSLGIRRIEGQIRWKNADQVAKIPDSWLWGDVGNYYGAVPHGFNFGENQFTVFFNSGEKVGSPSTVASIQPFSQEWKIMNLVTTGPKGSGDQVMIYSAPGQSTITLRGTVPLGSQRFAVKGSVHDPWALFTEQFILQLKNEGIEWIPSETPDHSPEQNVLVWESPTLEEIGKICLAESINLYADALLKKAWSPNDFAGWDELRNQVPASEIPSPFWADGSGLSPQNLVQPTQFTSYLNSLVEKENPKTWISWLPELGKSGTVRSFTQVEVPIYLKSGSIQYVRTYAGYFQSKTGVWHSFFVGAYPIAPNQRSQVRPFFQAFFQKLPHISEQ